MKRELQVEETKRLRQLWDEGKVSGTAKALDLRETRELAQGRLKKLLGRRAHAD